jgi:pimeloyl-ACP methyl ester carboxylesterase
MRRTWAAIALAGAVMAATGAEADIIKKEDMLRGITITRPQCAAIEQAVWVNASGRDFCVRYYLSTAGGEGTRPVVFIQGDYFGRLDPKTWNWADPSDARDINTDDLVRMADGFSKMTKTTAIYLARIGVEGTSGNHTARKTLLELNLMNAALDAIKQRHGFEGFHLVGQSGGAKLVGGLIGLRRDVACAVSGSGPLTTPGGPKTTDPGRTFFDATRNIPLLAQNRSLRLLLVSDPADKRVPIAQQTGFVEKMQRAGREVPQFMVEAIDEDHHGVVNYAELVAAGCVLGRTDAEIARAVSTVVKRSVEYNERRRKEAALRPGLAAAARQPVLDSRAAPGGA